MYLGKIDKGLSNHSCSLLTQWDDPPSKPHLESHESIFKLHKQFASENRLFDPQKEAGSHPFASIFEGPPPQMSSKFEISTPLAVW